MPVRHAWWVAAVIVIQVFVTGVLFEEAVAESQQGVRFLYSHASVNVVSSIGE